MFRFTERVSPLLSWGTGSMSRKRNANPMPHPDARDTPHECYPSQPRAGGRER